MLTARLTGPIAVLALVALLVAGDTALAQLPAPVDPEEQLAETAEFRLAEAKDFFEMGHLEDCAEQWAALLELAPPPALCLRLRKDSGFALFARMLEEPKLTESVAEFLRRARQEEERLRRDPEHINALVDDLQRTPTERRAAMSQLKQAGERAVPALFVRLAGAADAEERLNVNLALAYMRTQAVAPLVEALRVKDELVRQEVILLLGKAGDQRALAPLKGIVEDDQQSTALRASAKSALEKILKGASERSAAEYYFGLGELYYYQSPEVQPGYFEPKVPLWRWDANKQAIVCAEVSGQDFYIERCKECCYDGLAVAPADDNLRELLLSTYFVEKQVKGEDADPELTERIGLLVSSGGKPVLLAALLRQMQDDRPDLALAVVEVLRPVIAREGLVGSEEEVAGNALLDALEFPDQVLNFFAAEALAEAAPTEPFVLQERVVPYLVWGLLWGADVKTALVASTDRPLLNAFLGHLRALGCKVHEATSLAEAVAVFQGLPTPSLVVADAALMGELRPALLEDFRTRFVCRVVVGEADSESQVTEGLPEALVAANIDEGALAELLKKLLAGAGVHTRLTVEKSDVALVAATALAKLSRGGTVLDVAPASGALGLVMGHEDKDVRLAVLEALGNSRDAAALADLLAVGADAGEDEEVRLAALNAARVVLGAMQKAEKEVYQALVALLDEESEAIRLAAAACLSSGPFSAEQIVAVLAEKKVLKRAE